MTSKEKMADKKNSKWIIWVVIFIILLCIGVYIIFKIEIRPKKSTYSTERFFNNTKCSEILSESNFNTKFHKNSWVVDDIFFADNGACRFYPVEWKQNDCDKIASEAPCNQRGNNNASEIMECSKNHQIRYNEHGCKNNSYFVVEILPYENSNEYMTTLQNLRSQVGSESRMLKPNEVSGVLVESNNVGSYYFDYNASESISARFITTDKRFYVTLAFMPVINYDSSFNRSSITVIASDINNNLINIAKGI